MSELIDNGQKHSRASPLAQWVGYIAPSSRKVKPAALFQDPKKKKEKKNRNNFSSHTTRTTKTMHTMLRVLCFYLGIMTAFVASQDALPGFKATLSQSGINYAREVGIQFLQQKMQGTINIPDQEYVKFKK